MKKRKIYGLLATLDESERKEFKNFLASPIFNSSKTQIKIFDLWCKKVLDVEEKSDEPVDVSPEEFVKGTDFKLSRLDKLNSQLRGLLVEFLAFQGYRESKNKGIHAMRRLSRYFPSLETFQDIQQLTYKPIAKQKESPEKYYDEMRLQFLETVFRLRFRQTKSLWREDFSKLQQLLDKYYITERLRYACATANIRMVFRQDQAGPDPAAIADMMAQLEDSITPLAQAYYAAFRILSEEDPLPAMQELLANLDEHSSGYEQLDAMDLYGYALNFGLNQNNAGQLEYASFTAEIYRKLLETEEIMQHGKLLPAHYKNIVYLHCNIGQTAWARDFIENYENRLADTHDGYAQRFNRAVLAFYEGNYRECITEMREVLTHFKEDVFYGLDARFYIWRAFYEAYDELDADEVDEMFRWYDSLRIFIDRSEKISEHHKQHYRDFLRAFKQFLDIIEKDLGIDKLQALKEDIESNASFPSKHWILEKIVESISKG